MSIPGLSRQQIVSLGVQASRGNPVIWGGRIVTPEHSHDPEVSRPYLNRIANSDGPEDDAVRLARIAMHNTVQPSPAIAEGLKSSVDVGDGAAMRAALVTLHSAPGTTPLAQLLMQAGKVTWEVAAGTCDSPWDQRLGLAGTLRFLDALKDCDDPLRQQAAAALRVQGNFLAAVAVSQAIFGGQRLGRGAVPEANWRTPQSPETIAADIARTGKKAQTAIFVHNTDFRAADWREKLYAEAYSRQSEIGRVFIDQVAAFDSGFKPFAQQVQGMMQGAGRDDLVAALSEAALTVMADPIALGQSHNQLLDRLHHALNDPKQTPERDAPVPRRDAAAIVSQAKREEEAHV